MGINKLKRGQEIQLEISDLAFGGRGISKVDDLIFFVKDAIPNQTVIAKISKIKKKYVEAYNIETLKKSFDEIDSKCEHFKYCGGCSTQQLNYEKQLYYKQNQVYDIFEKIGKIKVGCWADLLVFNDNPLDDILRLKFPKMVIKSGKII